MSYETRNSPKSFTGRDPDEPLNDATKAMPKTAAPGGGVGGYEGATKDPASATTAPTNPQDDPTRSIRNDNLPEDVARSAQHSPYPDVNALPTDRTLPTSLPVMVLVAVFALGLLVLGIVLFASLAGSADDAASDDAAHPRIGLGGEQTALGETQRARHVGVVGG